MIPTLRRLAVLFLLLAVPGCPKWTAAAPEPLVRLDGDRLTLHAANQPLTEILKALAQQGVRIRIDPRINPTINARFDNRPVTSALAAILRSVDHALIWRQDGAADAEPRLWEIRIFFKGQEKRIRSLALRGNLEVVEGKDGSRYVKDILLLRLGPEMTPAALAVLMDRLGATLIDSYPPLGIVRLRLPHGSDVPAVADAIAGTPGIRGAEPDFAYPLEGGSPLVATSDASLRPASTFPSPDATVVAVMDSGLRADYRDNPYIQAAFDAISPGADVDDALGHGTQMALLAAGAVDPIGVAAGDTPASPVVAIRAFDDNGLTSTYTLMRGIDYAIANGARVVSLSWGSASSSAILEMAMAYAAGKGLILVAAAGNAPTGDPVYPAAYAGVIGVGALAPDGKAWEQSNFGDFVALSAPGIAELPVGYNGDPGVYAGTSIATAYTARRIASLLDRYPDADRETLLKLLREGR